MAPTAPATRSPAAARQLIGVMLTGDRLQHSLVAGRQASRLATALTDPADRAAVIVGALVHDIGYSPLITGVGWHPLDGARWLAGHGWPRPLCRLVVWHTASWHEGRIRGLYDVAVDEFGSPEPTDPLAAVIAAADLTTGPNGMPMSLDRRLVDIRHRYSPDSLVGQATRGSRHAAPARPWYPPCEVAAQTTAGQPKYDRSR